ncbi:hypothetical protein T06_5718 [Trichinella sp. T6]|nr:hypothetical protein T06_5718 [Trichinella sp. T6]
MASKIRALRLSYFTGQLPICKFLETELRCVVFSDHNIFSIRMSSPVGFSKTGENPFKVQ